MVLMVPRPSNRSSLVTSVRSMTRAVAARKRSAGSRCGNGSCCAARTISWVKAVSRSGAVAWANHSARLSGSRIRPLSASGRASQVETGESHNSLAGFFNSARTRGLSRDGACKAQSHTWVSRRSFTRAVP